MLTTRLRRLRHHPKMRDLIRETVLTKDDLVAPLFIKHGKNLKHPIASMPGQEQISVDRLEERIENILRVGLKSVLLFGIPKEKDGTGSDSYHDEGIVQQAIRKIKALAPELLVISDVCFCEYTDHGHCGVVNERTGRVDVDNDETLMLLQKQALSHVNAGADVVAPSGMMDGAVGAIRRILDEKGHTHIPIIGYSAKYASTLYGPFREAAEGAPKFGDRRSYQSDPANTRESLREVALDIEEGADVVMVKPAHAYLDVIARVKDAFPEVPLSAYHVSGEYAMLKAAILNGWLSEKAILEVLLSIKRAGADFIFTYFAEEVAEIL